MEPWAWRSSRQRLINIVGVGSSTANGWSISASIPCLSLEAGLIGSEASNRPLVAAMQTLPRSGSQQCSSYLYRSLLSGHCHLCSRHKVVMMQTIQLSRDSIVADVKETYETDSSNVSPISILDSLVSPLYEQPSKSARELLVLASWTTQMHATPQILSSRCQILATVIWSPTLLCVLQTRLPLLQPQLRLCAGSR